MNTEFLIRYLEGNFLSHFIIGNHLAFHIMETYDKESRDKRIRERAVTVASGVEGVVSTSATLTSHW